MLKISKNTNKLKLFIILILYILRHVSPFTLPRCIFTDRIRIAGDSNIQNNEILWAQIQSLNAKILRPCAIRLLDLSTESSMNEGNATAHLKLLLVFTSWNNNCNKLPDSNTSEFQYDNFVKFPCPATATTRNVLKPV